MKPFNLISEDLATDSGVPHWWAFGRSIVATGYTSAGPIARHLANELDPELVSVFIHVSDQPGAGLPGSAAKKAATVRKFSFVRQN